MVLCVHGVMPQRGVDEIWGVPLMEDKMDEWTPQEVEIYAAEITRTVRSVGCAECNAGPGMYCREQVSASTNKLEGSWKITSKVHMPRIEQAIRVFFQQHRIR